MKQRVVWTWTLILLSLVPMVASAQQAFDVAAATDAYMGQLSSEQKARSDAYFEGGYWLMLWGFLYGAIELWLLLRLGVSARMRDLAAGLTSRKPLRTAFYAVQFLLLTAVLESSP